VSSITIVGDAPNCGVTYDHHYDDCNSFIIQATDHFPCWLHQPEGINKDLTVWLDGARPPSKYVLKNKVNSTNSKIHPTQILHYEMSAELGQVRLG
jgi:hypothetical protein